MRYTNPRLLYFTLLYRHFNFYLRFRIVSDTLVIGKLAQTLFCRTSLESGTATAMLSVPMVPPMVSMFYLASSTAAEVLFVVACVSLLYL